MKYAIRKTAVILVAVAVILAALPAAAQDLAEFEKRTTEFTLNNGLKFIVLERHHAPVVSFNTHADVGAVDEVKGITGMAHLFEHMAFKGSQTIGTRDYPAEEKAMMAVDDTFLELKAEKAKAQRADKKRLEQLQQKFKQAQQNAQKHLVHDEFEEILTRQGSAGLNAGTGYDATVYVVSLPANKTELWMYMESERYLNPVLREFYKEKDVVMEERRLRTESQPVGRLLEEFLAIAYKAHPYGEPVVGHMSDLQTLTRAEARDFFDKYYSPANLTVAIVGDVDPAQIKKLAQKYFGRIPKRPKPDPVETVEPPQLGERRVTIQDPAQPFVLIGYHKPGINHPDNAVFDAITDVIGSGRTSRLYKALVKEKKVAVAATAFPGMPGDKYPGLFLFYAVPARGRTNQECETAIYDEIEKLKNEPVTPEELEKAKTRARASLIRQLDSSSGLAQQIAYYDVVTGDWRNLFKQLQKIEQVNADDIIRVANECFVTKNRTVGLIETDVADAPPSTGE